MPAGGLDGSGQIRAASRRALRGSGGAGVFGADVRRRVLRAVGADRDVMLYAARVSVWARWLVWVVAVAELAYRPQLWWPTDKQYLLLNVPLVAFNGLVHWRLRRGRTVSWGWLLLLSVWVPKTVSWLVRRHFGTR